MKVFLIRHAESKFNKLMQETYNQHEIQNRQKNLVYYVKIKKDSELIDAGITELGLEQCRHSALKNHENLARVKVVLVSPMNRALQTANFMFEKFLPENLEGKVGHPVQFIVIPELREVLESVCDIINSSEEKQQLYPNYDFTRVKKLENTFGYGWFCERMLNQYTRKVLRDEIAKSANEPDLKKAFRILDVMGNLLPKYLEDGREILHRIQGFRKWFQNFVEEHNYKDDEIAIVGHSFYFECLSAKNFGENFNPIDGFHMTNCELVEFYMDPKESL